MTFYKSVKLYIDCKKNRLLTRDTVAFSLASNLDELVKSRKTPFFVIPSRIVVRDDDQAGTEFLDSGFHRGDDFLRVHHI